MQHTLLTVLVIAVFDWVTCTPEIGKRRFHSENASNVSVHIRLEEFKNTAIGGHFGFVGFVKSHEYPDAIVFEKLRFQTVFRPHGNEKPTFLNSSGLRNVFEKLRFHKGLVWTADLTVKIRVRFQISLVWMLLQV